MGRRRQPIERPTAAEIVAFRERHGLSRGQLADALGVGGSTIWRWETQPEGVERAYEAQMRRLVEYMRHRDRRGE